MTGQIGASSRRTSRGERNTLEIVLQDHIDGITLYRPIINAAGDAVELTTTLSPFSMPQDEPTVLGYRRSA